MLEACCLTVPLSHNGCLAGLCAYMVYIYTPGGKTIGYQPRPDKRGWFDDECRVALDEKNIAYKKWIDRPTTISKTTHFTVYCNQKP